ncbi:hypothetical protein BDN71DRAFT_1388351 [Pleurotus eryngii]|uniref:ATP-dependent DNA helicase n=1 Tax=Pleurotus eryngii TaxID=5323 RepID=A0A9P5ZZB5_PLEER|nr:hypothetical protein BDN71DRAFT_1388351 [Pleurotus eryngii]
MVCSDPKSLINFIYPHFDGPTPPTEYFLDRVILAARNTDVDDINEAILQ